MVQKTYSLDLGGKPISITVSDLAEQANGNVMVRAGDTVVFVTCVISKNEREGIDFFPLTVEYEEKFYAAGKIKGPRYIKREGRPSDGAITTARLIDRAIRPLFPKALKRDVQVVNTVLSWDGENDPDVLGLIGASCALTISDIPWNGPIGAVRIGEVDGSFTLNTAYGQREKSSLDLVLSATAGDKNEILINMVEAGCKEVSEEKVVAAYDFASGFLKDLLNFQNTIRSELGRPKLVLTAPEPNPELLEEVKEFIGDRLEKTLFGSASKTERQDEETRLKDELGAHVLAIAQDPKMVKGALRIFELEVDRLIHEKAISDKKRVDGRKPDELRPLSCEVGLLPRTHGSGLFMRGTTKALSILTLGSPGDQQLLELMEISGKKRFMHHYNFPPFSSGEIAPMRGPGRREIGHGMLAEKALEPIIPDYETFPYTIRIVTEILSSNGSTSMASVCASSLALMDAGVPIPRPAAGISIGLASDDHGNYQLLCDIQGPEDHHGDMDFKVAGTRSGITAIQMDVKIRGINRKIFTEALEQAKKARLKILERIEQTLASPRPNLSQYAPRIITLQINPDRIRDVIGPGGKIINAIIGETGVTIDIEDSGKIFVASPSEESLNKAVEWIRNLTREVKVGETFQGKITRILAFGAFAEILPGQEGLIHISQLAPWRVERVEDVVKIGDVVPVKVISIDEQGRINLSLKEMRATTQNDNRENNTPRHEAPPASGPRRGFFQRKRF